MKKLWSISAFSTVGIPDFIALYLLHFTDVAFLQSEGKTLHQQKDYDSLYCDSHFIEVVWKWNRNISEVCLDITVWVWIFFIYFNQNILEDWMYKWIWQVELFSIQPYIRDLQKYITIPHFGLRFVLKNSYFLRQCYA